MGAHCENKRRVPLIAVGLVVVGTRCLSAIGSAVAAK